MQFVFLLSIVVLFAAGVQSGFNIRRCSRLCGHPYFSSCKCSGCCYGAGFSGGECRRGNWCYCYKHREPVYYGASDGGEFTSGIDGFNNDAYSTRSYPYDYKIGGPISPIGGY